MTSYFEETKEIWQERKISSPGSVAGVPFHCNDKAAIADCEHWRRKVLLRLHCICYCIIAYIVLQKWPINHLKFRKINFRVLKSFY